VAQLNIPFFWDVFIAEQLKIPFFWDVTQRNFPEERDP
jgi:hypothetical protein